MARTCGKKSKWQSTRHTSMREKKAFMLLLWEVKKRSMDGETPVLSRLP